MSAAVLMAALLAASAPADPQTAQLLDKSGTCYNVFLRAWSDETDPQRRAWLETMRDKAAMMHMEHSGKFGIALKEALHEWDARLEEKMKTGLSFNQYVMICSNAFRDGR